jgi:hypothetical protein
MTQFCTLATIKSHGEAPYQNLIRPFKFVPSFLVAATTMDSDDGTERWRVRPARMEWRIRREYSSDKLRVGNCLHFRWNDALEVCTAVMEWRGVARWGGQCLGEGEGGVGIFILRLLRLTSPPRSRCRRWEPAAMQCPNILSFLLVCLV